MLRLTSLLLLVLCCLAVKVHAQDNPDVVDKITGFPNAFFYKVNKKTASLEDKLTQQTEKYLQRMARQEKKLQKQLNKVDSSAAKQLFANSQQQYQQLMAKINSNAVLSKVGLKGEYLPGMDSLKTSLSFLQQNSQLLGSTKDIQQKVTASLGNVNELEGKLNQTEEVKAFIQQRKQQITDALSRYTNLPGGVTSCVTNFKAQAYYYNAQVKEYKDMLNDPDKMMEKGLALLNKLPAFTQFMKQHGELSSLFSLPADYGSSASLAGLQTRAQVQQQIQTQLASGGP